MTKAAKGEGDQTISEHPPGTRHCLGSPAQLTVAVAPQLFPKKINPGGSSSCPSGTSRGCVPCQKSGIRVPCSWAGSTSCIFSFQAGARSLLSHRSRAGCFVQHRSRGQGAKIVPARASAAAPLLRPQRITDRGGPRTSAPLRSGRAAGGDPGRGSHTSRSAADPATPTFPGTEYQPVLPAGTTNDPALRLDPAPICLALASLPPACRAPSLCPPGLCCPQSQRAAQRQRARGCSADEPGRERGRFRG